MLNDPKTLMRSANIPPFAYNTTLPKAGYGALRTVLEGKEYRSEFGLVSYRLVGSGVSAARACALFAKELTLSKQFAMHMPFATLRNEVRHLDYRVDGGTPLELHTRIGNGYLVVPDIAEALKGGGEFPADEALGILSTHCSRGGALVLGVGPTWTTDHPNLSPSFVALVSDFVEFSV